MGFKGLYDAKLVSIHILGKPATGDLKRPFKAPSMFGREFFFSLSSHLFVFIHGHYSPTLESTGPQTDAASIAEAEKRVGKKEE